MTLLCSYHHRLLHKGSFSIARETDDTLRFLTADGRTIPRGGYRLEDFVDDDVGAEADGECDPSREGFCTERVQTPSAEFYAQPDRGWPNHEVREPATIYGVD